jgi:hypothetical protein
VLPTGAVHTPAAGVRVIAALWLTPGVVTGGVVPCVTEFATDISRSVPILVGVGSIDEDTTVGALTTACADEVTAAPLRGCVCSDTGSAVSRVESLLVVAIAPLASVVNAWTWGVVSSTVEK